MSNFFKAELSDAELLEFGETLELRTEKLADLRANLAQLVGCDWQTYVPDTDASLLRFIRGKKYDLEKAQKCIVNTVEFHEQHPVWTNDLTAHEFREFTSLVQFLEHRDSENRIVMFIKASRLLKLFTSEFQKRHPYGLIRFNIYLLQMLSYIPEIQLNGLVIIGSFSDLTFWDTTTLATIAPVNERLAFFKYIGCMTSTMSL